jgi:hypothetical protein
LWITNDQGKKKNGPRPELVDEIHREAKTEFFCIYNSENFLKYSKEYLSTQVTDESISQVHEITKESRISSPIINDKFKSLKFLAPIPVDNLKFLALRPVYLWLENKYPNLIVQENTNDSPDYIVYDPKTGKNFGFEIRTLRDPSSVKQLAIWYCSTKVEPHLDEMTFVFVFLDEDELEKAAWMFGRTDTEIPLKLNFLFAIVNAKSEGELIADFRPVINISRGIWMRL